MKKTEHELIKSREKKKQLSRNIIFRVSILFERLFVEFRSTRTTANEVDASFAHNVLADFPRGEKSIKTLNANRNFAKRKFAAVQNGNNAKLRFVYTTV